MGPKMMLITVCDVKKKSQKPKQVNQGTSTLSPYKFSLWFSLLKTCAGYLLRVLQAISSANINIILSSGIPSRFTVLDKMTKTNKYISREGKKQNHIGIESARENSNYKINLKRR